MTFDNKESSTSLNDLVDNIDAEDRSKAPKDAFYNSPILKLKKYLLFMGILSCNKNTWTSSKVKTTVSCRLYIYYLLAIIEFMKFLLFLVIKCFKGDEEDLLAGIFLFLLKSLTAIGTIMIIWNRHLLNKFLEDFSEAFSHYDISRDSLTSWALSKIMDVKVFTIFMVVVSTVFQVILPIVLVEPISSLDTFAFPVSRESDLFVCMLFLNCIIFVILNSLLAPLLVLGFIFLSFVSDEFKFLCDKFGIAIQKMLREHIRIFFPTHNSEIILQLINCYNWIFQLLDSLNSMLHVVNAVLVMIFASNCCIIAYQISNNIIKLDTLITELLLNTCTILSCSLMLYKGLLIYSNAHRITKLLYAIPVNDLPRETLVKLSFFLHRLSSEQIGVSIGGFFVINPASVLTILGSILTYSIVAYQTRG